MTRVAALLVYLCGVASADSSVTEPLLCFEWLDSWNRHWSGGRGADGANHSGVVTLRLDADGHCELADQGKRVDSVLDGDRQSRAYHPDAPSVKLLTIHSSKGLEFPVVLVAGLGLLANPG